MTMLNGVLKAIESLNVLQQSTNAAEPSTRKFEVTTQCLAVANGICSISAKSSRNFSHVLGLSIKTLLTLCNDEESDVRTVADESLNKIIRSMSDGNIQKIQFELYNEIHRNDNWRSLRAALRRFGLLSHTIKPVKGKPYISNLIPCIVAISKRTEESVIDTLSQSLPLILKSLGPFMMDKDAKTLLKAFYPNLSSPQATFRRNAANMILATCLHCRKPRALLFYVLQYLIDTMIPLVEMETNLHLVVGGLGCLRIMLPHLDVSDDSEPFGYSVDCFLQIYELSLRYIHWHADHNVVNAALETLAQLLRSTNEELIRRLTEKCGIPGGNRIGIDEQTPKSQSCDSKDLTTDKSSNDLTITNSMNDVTSSRKILNIGSFADADVPLKYCCRYLTSSFLLAGSRGQLVPDTTFRVSVKSLALICIGHIVRLYPRILLDTVEKTTDVQSKDCQAISDILLFSGHSDPQLRGNVSCIIGLFLNSVYLMQRSSYEAFRTSVGTGSDNKSMQLDNLITLLVNALGDESAATCRQALNAVNTCIIPLLDSPDSRHGLCLLYKCLSLVDNIYFLVKMNLAQVLGELPYTTIKYLTGNTLFHDEVVTTVMKLLGDEDPRVRHSASETVVKFIAKVYYERAPENEVIRKASSYTEEFLTSITSSNHQERHSYHVDHKFFVNGLSEPFLSFYLDNCTNCYHRENLEDALSIIIGTLVETLLVNSSKHLIFGCYEALSELSQAYPTALYSDAWDCRQVKTLVKKPTSKVHSSNRSISSENNVETPSMTDHLSPIGIELLCLTLSHMCSDPISLDLSIHRHLLRLAGNLLSGIALRSLKSVDVAEKNDTKDAPGKMWNLFENKDINRHFELLFQHIMRIINIYVHIIEDTPVVSSHSKSLPYFATSLSPRKKIDAQLDPRLRERSEKGITSLSKAGKDYIGSFHTLAQYTKLHAILKAAHLNYISTLDVEASQMYLELLHTALEVLSQILEIASTYEARKIAEECLHYLEKTLTLSATVSVQCVRQLLKSLFGMNLSSRWDEMEDVKGPEDKPVKSTAEDARRGLYDRCYQKPVRYMADLIKTIGNNCGESETIVGWGGGSTLRLRRDSDRKLALVFKSFAQSNNPKAFFASFIRVFEPMVIKSLNLYTTTTSIACQCQVLSLLGQLVQFHVNYCLLDTDKTFIDFVLGQFSFIEESQISQTQILLPKIFSFLVNLSYEKFHSKVIIDIREIIKLCDGLMASGQPLETHCIPAVIPVVEDIFLARSTTAMSSADLDTTREYLMSMLLRLVEHPEVVDLLAQCLIVCRHDEDGEDKWRKWSRLTIDAVLPALSAGKIKIENEKAVVALIKLLSTVSSIVFRPVDPLLTILFTVPPAIEAPTVKLERWLGMVNVVLLTLISYTKEETMLARLSDMKVPVTNLFHDLDLDNYLHDDTVDPLNAANVEACSVSPERLLASFIFNVVLLAASRIRRSLDHVEYCENLCRGKRDDSLAEKLAFFLQLCVHMFESGSHCKVANATIVMMNEGRVLPVQQISRLMLEISKRNLPFLTTHWIYLMTLLGYSDHAFWSSMIGGKNRRVCDVNFSITTLNKRAKKSIDTRIVSECATILFCDHLCENINDAESLSWLVMNHIEDLIDLAHEMPVRDLVTAAVHRSSAASGLLIQAVAARCVDFTQPSLMKKILKTLECAHTSQSGAVILILIPRFISSTCLAISWMAAEIARKRIELLLSLNSEDVVEQLTKEDLTGLMEMLQVTKLARKHPALVTLMNKLISQFYDMSPLELDNSRPFNPQIVKNVQLTKQWFMSQVKLRCCSSGVGQVELAESAKLLGNLDFEDCEDILTSKEFDVRILSECIKLGSRVTLEENTQRTAFINAKDYSSQMTNKDSSECLSPLYLSATQCLSSYVRHINDLVPKPHNVYDPQGRDAGKPSKAMKYTTKFGVLMGDQIFWDRLFAVIPAVSDYMKSLRDFHEHYINSSDIKFDEEDLAKFAMLCLEVAHWMVHADEERTRSLRPQEFELCLTCATEVLMNERVSKLFGGESHYTWVCSAANALTRLVEYWLSPKTTGAAHKGEILPRVDARGLRLALEQECTFARACLQMAALVSWLEGSDCQSRARSIPDFARDSIASLIVLVSRLELVNSFVLTPPLVWTHGWSVQGSGRTLCHFPLSLSTAESNFLHDLGILRQFVYRVTLLGWVSRQQFEEIWMALLSVLGASSSESEATQEPEVAGINQTTSLAVQGITRLLMTTLLIPQPGNPVCSRAMHHARDPQLALQKPASQRLFTVQGLLSWKYECAQSQRSGRLSDLLGLEQIFTRGNIERDRVANGYDHHSYSQLSMSYAWASCGLHGDKLLASVLRLKERRQEALASSSLDLESCVIFLIEFYSRWMALVGSTPPRLLSEVVKSIIAISDLFVERCQFQWMLDTCWEVERSHPVDDDVLHHSLIFAICKAAAVLVPLDIESLDKVKRATEIGLRSGYLSCRIATLHGILCLLQSAVQAHCEETMNAVHPLAVKYIQRHVDGLEVGDIAATECEEHQRTMWALVFFLLEHDEDTGPPDVEAPAVLELALTLANLPNVSVALHRTILHGVERLIATKSVTGRVAEQIVRLSLDRLKQSSFSYVLPALRLLLTCMYTEAADRFNRTAALNEEQPLPDIEPEALMQTIERTSAIFDRIKRGHPMEVRIFCAVLPEILGDFFPPFETLTKVIGEFLSPQQPHPRLISSVVFKVCERVAGNADQLALLQDWVVFSLPNFIQSLPLVTSTWCLSCFFVSASTNHWLRALFPHLQSRIGKYEYEDKKILCIAALDFYIKLSTDVQKKAFMDSISTAGCEPSSPFGDIVVTLSDNSK